MKDTSRSQASRAQSGLRLTAQQYHDGEVKRLARRNVIVITHLRAEIMAIVTIGIDLAKNVFAALMRALREAQRMTHLEDLTLPRHARGTQVQGVRLPESGYTEAEKGVRDRTAGM